VRVRGCYGVRVSVRRGGRQCDSSTLTGHTASYSIRCRLAKERRGADGAQAAVLNNKTPAALSCSKPDPPWTTPVTCPQCTDWQQAVEAAA
jgi:hypothetical protein